MKHQANELIFIGTIKTLSRKMAGRALNQAKPASFIITLGEYVCVCVSVLDCSGIYYFDAEIIKIRRNFLHNH